MDGDGFDAHLAARPVDPQGDLSTIGDEDFLEHGVSLERDVPVLLRR